MDHFRRVTSPLQRPWLASNYDDQRIASAAWKERIEALAWALNLRHDQACTDTSRLFYLPRRLATSPPPETLVLDGARCDLFELPPTDRSGGPAPSGKRRRKRRDEEPLECNDPTTGEAIDLRAWDRAIGGKFELLTALRERRPDVLIGELRQGGKQHLRCANEDDHTQPGADGATFIANASDSTSRRFVYHCRHAHCDGRDRLMFLKLMVEKEWITVDDLRSSRFQSQSVSNRPLIQVTGGEIADIVDRGEEALLKAELGVYQRGTLLVRAGHITTNISRGRRVTSPRIIPLGDHALVEALTVAAVWEKFDGRSETMVIVDAPLKIANTLQQRTGKWRLPSLMGVIDAPTLRPDGSVLATAGYDPVTGLLLEPGGLLMAEVPDLPTRQDAMAAMDELKALIVTFSFLDEPSRSVALSGILTCSIRRSLATAPLHAFTAPVAGSGKTKLADICSVIATGRVASVMAQGKNEEELEKRLGSMFLAGEHVLAIDNCEAPLGGEFLCSVLTQRSVRCRILGLSQMPELPTNAFVTATGNNLVFFGDMSRRAVLCHLDPAVERPELRKFDVDPVLVAHQQRGRLLLAALTILRAYHLAGRPDAPVPLGSFEEWSSWVRGALLWLGCQDPVATMEKVRRHDPKLAALRRVLTQWKQHIGSREVSTARIKAQASEREPVKGEPQHASLGDFLHPEFHEALMLVASKDGAIGSMRLGRWIGENVGRVVDGTRIVSAPMSEGVQQWKLEEVKAEAA